MLAYSIFASQTKYDKTKVSPESSKAVFKYVPRPSSSRSETSQSNEP